MGWSDRLIGMKVSSMQAPAMQVNDALQHAYRATFEVYAAKLKVLQSLLDDRNSLSGQIDAAMLAVEQARLAYSCARDRLANELMRVSAPQGAEVDEQRIRSTAHLLWEIAGRPEGTAERDWRQAEKLVFAASC